MSHVKKSHKPKMESTEWKAHIDDLVSIELVVLIFCLSTDNAKMKLSMKS